MSLRQTYPLCVGYIFYYLAYHIYEGMRLKKAKDSFWNKKDSAYVKENGKIDFFLIFLVAARSIIATIVIVLLYYIFSTAQKSGVSSAIIISLFSSGVFTTSLLFYIVFKEKLAVKHFIGMLMIVLSIIMISNSKRDSVEKYAGYKYSMHILIPISLALLNVVCFTITGLLTRASKYSKMTSF